MRRTISIAIAALCLAGAFVASAQTKEAKDEIDDVTEYTFPDEAVVGGLPGTDEIHVVVRKPPKTRSLIKVRSNFVHAMLKSVEDI